jgi:hypothetical protein
MPDKVCFMLLAQASAQIKSSSGARALFLLAKGTRGVSAE